MKRFDAHNGISLRYAVEIVESVFYSHLFCSFTQRRILKRLMIALSTLCVALCVCAWIACGTDLSRYLSTFAVCGFVFALISLLYLYERFDRDETELHTDPGFWVALGVAVFYSGSSFVMSLHDFIVKENLNLSGARLDRVVQQVLGLFLYGCISVSIILHQKNESAADAKPSAAR